MINRHWAGYVTASSLLCSANEDSKGAILHIPAKQVVMSRNSALFFCLPGAELTMLSKGELNGLREWTDPNTGISPSYPGAKTNYISGGPYCYYASPLDWCISVQLWNRWNLSGQDGCMAVFSQLPKPFQPRKAL